MPGFPLNAIQVVRGSQPASFLGYALAMSLAVATYFIRKFDVGFGSHVPLLMPTIATGCLPQGNGGGHELVGQCIQSIYVQT